VTAIKGIWWELQRVAAQPSGSGSAAVEEQARRLSGAAAELAACMSRWEQAPPSDPLDLEVIGSLGREVLPAAVAAGTLLQQYWAQPEQVTAARLEAARAAATRSCAYLGCSSLGGEGGPDAGKRAGSLRCSACRAVWYCGTACSHADWRQGGHRKVCAALAAERRSGRRHGGCERPQHGCVLWTFA
jgi:hypothetical protein